ncbi:hypothetical protein [Nocardia sp. NPDC051570]|uniref:hypothetical protein n=1 Tax=Nocardia sp. NPDC051570 TaxID=3364324 RepID=UPI0037949ABB
MTGGSSLGDGRRNGGDANAGAINGVNGANIINVTGGAGQAQGAQGKGNTGLAPGTIDGGAGVDGGGGPASKCTVAAGPPGDVTRCEKL